MSETEVTRPNPISEAVNAVKVKKAKKQMFLTFLMYGWLLIVIVILGIVVLISSLLSGPKP